MSHRTERPTAVLPAFRHPDPVQESASGPVASPPEHPTEAPDTHAHQPTKHPDPPERRAPLSAPPHPGRSPVTLPVGGSPAPASDFRRPRVQRSEPGRSEERRVGKEGMWGGEHEEATVT